MKKLFLSIGLFLFVFAAKAQKNKEEVIAKLKSMEVSWNHSPLDKDHGAKVYSEILAEDFYATCSDGIARNKVELIKHDTDVKEQITSLKMGAMTVKFFADNLASVTGTHSITGKNLDGKAFTKSFAWTDVYMERNGKWQCIASGTTVK